MWLPVVDNAQAGGKQWVQVGRREGGTCKRLTEFHPANTAGSWMETTQDTHFKRVYACCGGSGIVQTPALKIIFISDLESGYRGRKSADCEAKMEQIIAQRPDLVIHGGDLYDGQYSSSSDKEIDGGIWNMLYEANIPMITVNGNHDGFDQVARNFVQQSFLKTQALVGADNFKFWPVLVEGQASETGYYAEFKGVQIASFLYTNPDGPSQETINLMQSQFLEGTTKPTLVVNHAPIQTLSSTRLQAMVFGLAPGSAVLSGHTHTSRKTPYDNTVTTFVDYTAPYPHRWESMVNGKATTPKENGMIRFAVSPTDGVISHEVIDSGTARDWKDGALCGLGTTCNSCINGYEYWFSKAMTACGAEPKWEDGTLCAAGTTCNQCKNDYSYWYGKAFTACGAEPKWGDGTYCLAGTSCNACQNGAHWWVGAAGMHCGAEPCWTAGTICGVGTTEKECCNGASCPWYMLGICTCN
jgi:predicted phosphodiesterase